MVREDGRWISATACEQDKQNPASLFLDSIVYEKL